MYFIMYTGPHWERPIAGPQTQVKFWNFGKESAFKQESRQILLRYTWLSYGKISILVVITFFGLCFYGTVIRQVMGKGSHAAF